MSNMVVQTNILALNSHRNMKNVGIVQSRASNRLSSGYRINTAADDAAGLAISEKMRAQIRGLDQASRNAQDGQALVQTAEGGMQEIDNMLQRIRELVVQSSNDTNDRASGDRQKIQDEVDQLVEEIDSMAERVEFNKKKVINGTYASQTAMTGVLNSNLALAQTRLTSASQRLTDAASDLAAITASGTAAQINDATAKVNMATASRNGASNAVDLMSNAVSDLATQPPGESLFFQVGANATQGIGINISRIKSDVLGIGNGAGRATIDLVETTGATTSPLLDVMDNAISYVTTERAKLGAIQNRLEYTTRSLDISSENLSDSESRVRNADMAKEMMNFTKSNVLQQAAVSMLAQANQLPQNLLQLLR